MQVQHHVPKGASGHFVARVQHLFPMTGKSLQQQVLDAQLVSGALEGHDVMGLLIDGLGVFFPREHVLAQVEDGDVPVMGMFGEQVQDLLVVGPFGHQVVQDQDAPFVPEPLVQIGMVG